MLEEHFENIFVIVKRLDGYSENSGTSLGLALSNKIIEKLNGKNWPELPPNCGTSFILPPLSE